MTRFVALLLALTYLAAPAAAAQPDGELRAALQRVLDAHLAAHAKIEHISAISLSVSLHGSTQNINVAAGATPQQLWQIGSITKSFTAATILQLEAEGRLSIDQTVGHWLPEYPAWRRVTIRRLLNMTSGIPTFDLVPAWQRDYAKDPHRNFTAAELIAYLYPGRPHAPPPTTGWSYSNTNYLLAQLIIERATHHSYASEIERRFLRSSIGLASTYYSATQYPRAVRDRMVPGYFFIHDPEAAALARCSAPTCAAIASRGYRPPAESFRRRRTSRAGCARFTPVRSSRRSNAPSFSLSFR
jgi:D-alanyl-D-alanine carboxypeptidase